MKDFLAHPWYPILSAALLAIALVLIFAFTQNKKENTFISKFRNFVDKPAEKLGTTIFGFIFAIGTMLIVACVMAMLVYLVHGVMFHELLTAYWASLGLGLDVGKVLGDIVMSLLHLLIWSIDFFLQFLRSIVDKTYSVKPQEFNILWLLPPVGFFLARKMIPIKIGWLLSLLPFVVGIMAIIWLYSNPQAAKEKIAQVKLEQARKTGTVTTDTADTTIVTGRWEERISPQGSSELWRLKKALKRAEKQLLWFEKNQMEGDENYNLAKSELERVREDYEDELGKSLHTSMEFLAGKIPEEYVDTLMGTTTWKTIMPSWRLLVENETNDPSWVFRRHLLYFEASIVKNKLELKRGLAPDTVGKFGNIFKLKGWTPLIVGLVFLGLILWGANWIFTRKKSNDDG